jgi:hypothetical protein
VADPEGPAQDIRPSRRRERRHGVERGWYRHQRLAGPTVIVQGLYCLLHRFEGLGQNRPTTVAIVSRSSSTSRASTRLFSPTCSITRTTRQITLRNRVTARRRLSSPGARRPAASGTIAMRVKAVSPTRTAPPAAKTCCQVPAAYRCRRVRRIADSRQRSPVSHRPARSRCGAAVCGRQRRQPVRSPRSRPRPGHRR